MQKTLESIGFSDKQAKVYLACLELGKSTAFEISKKAGIKRPTTYFILEEFLKQGIISISKTSKVSYFVVSHPRKLLTNYKAKEKKLENALGDLTNLYNMKKEKPKILTYEGSKGVESIYDEVSEYAKQKGKELLFFGTVDYLKKLHRDSYAYWLKSVKNKKSTVREILNDDESNKQYISTIKKMNNPNHKIKVVPKNIKAFKNDNIIFGDKVALFSSNVDFFAVVVQDKAISDTFKSFFEIAWQHGKTVK